MSDDRTIKGNDLARFEKQSETLSLEQYSACEISAGCIGVVFRWSDLASAISVNATVLGTGKSLAVYFDGVAFERRFPKVEVGAHVLALQVVAGEGLTAAVVTMHERPGTQRGPDARRWRFQTDTASWRMWLGPAAPQGWAEPGFDDRRWATPLAHPSTRSDWDFRFAEREGAVLIGAPLTTAPGTVMLLRGRCAYTP